MEAPGGVAPPGLPRLAGEALLLGQGAVTVRTMPFAPRAVKPRPAWAEGIRRTRGAPYTPKQNELASARATVDFGMCSAQ